MSRHHGRRAGVVRTFGQLGRAMVRLPWNLGFWTAQQTLDLLDPRRPLQRTTDALDALSRAAREPLERPLDELQRGGERLQEGMADSTVRLLSGSWREPRAAFDQAWGAVARTWRLFVDDLGGDRR